MEQDMMEQADFDGVDANIIRVYPSTRLPAELVDLVSDCANSVADEKRRFPQRIWFYWNSGLKTAPELVKRSLDTWRTFNPDYDVTVLTDDNLATETGVDFSRIWPALTAELGFASRSDLLRVYLMWKFGGIWVDATTFCLQPLSAWLPEQMKRVDFFCFRQQRRNDRQMVSWFLASRPGNRIARDLLQRSLAYLTRIRTRKLEAASFRDMGLDNRDFAGPPGHHALLDVFEAEGKLPYYWMFYLFAEVLAAHPAYWTALRKTGAPFVQPCAGYPSFLRAVVAKNTHKWGYPESEQFEQRRRAIFANSEPSFLRLCKCKALMEQVTMVDRYAATVLRL